jgi:SAM-dependent methyltransferase
VKITGERVTTNAGGFNPTYQRHVAAYLLSEPFLPDGRVLDVGCGTGHSYELLAPRETVGVDAAASVLAGQERETHVADMRRLPFADEAFASAIAVQSIEHVPDGQRALTEIARVLAPGGVAVLITPNRLTFGRPDEIIDPYHYVEYDAGELRELCRGTFPDVQLHGIFGSARYSELVAEERGRLDQLLRLDPLHLRRLVPRRLRQRLYDALLARARAAPDARAGAISPADFTLGSEGLEAALDLVAVCRVG